MAGEHVRRRQKQATGSQSYITEVQRTKKTSRTRVTKGGEGRREGLLDIIVVALLLQLKYQGYVAISLCKFREKKHSGCETKGKKKTESERAGYERPLERNVSAKRDVL